MATFSAKEIAQWAGQCLTPGVVAYSDGLACFAAVMQAGCTHHPTVVGARKPRELSRFKWINTVLGNPKTSLAGSYHGFDFGKYAPHYLAAFAYRFNRRLDLRALPTRLVVAAASCPPRTERMIRAAEDAC